MNKVMKLDVVVNHCYSPIKVRAYDIGRVGYMESAGSMVVTIPAVEGEQGIFGRGTITIPEGQITLQVCHNGWATVAAGGCDIEWTDGPHNWQARIVSGQINGFPVSARGEMALTKI